MADGNEFKGTYADLVGATSKNKGKVIQVDLPTANLPDNFFES